MMRKKQNPSESNHSSPSNNRGIYEIKIKGLLEDHWGQWFEGMALVRHENPEAEQDCTLIIGLIVDQPALHGLLAKIRDLNLTLISVRKLDPKDQSNLDSEQNGFDAESSQKECP